MFIRLSSPTPLAELLARQDVQALLRELEALGIFADRPWR